MSDGVAATLARQVEYYRARAAEYDEWWFRRGRYDRGADLNALWFADAAHVDRELEALGVRGTVLELAGGTGIWSQKLVRHADHLTILDAGTSCMARVTYLTHDKAVGAR